MLRFVVPALGANEIGDQRGGEEGPHDEHAARPERDGGSISG